MFESPLNHTVRGKENKCRSQLLSCRHSSFIEHQEGFLYLSEKAEELTGFYFLNFGKSLHDLLHL